MNSKLCSQCCQVKPLDQFNRMARAKGGYRSECKQCRKQNLQGEGVRQIMAEEWPHFRALLGPVLARERLMEAMGMTHGQFVAATRGLITDSDRAAWRRYAEEMRIFERGNAA